MGRSSFRGMQLADPAVRHRTRPSCPPQQLKRDLTCTILICSDMDKKPLIRTRPGGRPGTARPPGGGAGPPELLLAAA